jgi:hypothetical protein
MKKIYLILRNVSIVLITGIIISSCKKDDNNTTNTATATDKITGTWTSGPASSSGPATAQLITQLTNHFIGMGLSAGEAQLQADIFEKGLLDSYKGTLQVNSDHTFISDLPDFPFMGTWDLNPSLTLLSVQVPRSIYEPQVNKTFTWSDLHTYDVIDLTSSNPKLHFSDRHTGYLNNGTDDSNDSIDINVDVYFTK